MAAREQKMKEMMKKIKLLETQTKKLVEEANCCVLVLSVDPKSKDLIVSGDRLSMESVNEDLILKEKIKSILERSRKAGEHIFAINGTAVCPEITNNFVSVYESMCHDSSEIRKTFAAIMKSEGYGRNAGKKYGIGNAPGWWDEQVVEWNLNLNGVNIPNHWVKKERGPWLRALQELLLRGYDYHMEHQVDENGPIMAEGPVPTYTRRQRSNLEELAPPVMGEVNLTGVEQSEEENEELVVDCTIGGYDINDLMELSFSRLLEPTECEELVEPVVPLEIVQIVEPVKKKTNKNLSQATISKCSLCGRMFVTQKLMTDHMKNVHIVICKSQETVEKPQDKNLQENEKVDELKCTVCGKLYKSAVWLKKHKQSLNH